jgi:indoleamine 2,3-dioxygenase
MPAEMTIPKLSNYGIDPKTGFMPNPPPLWRLPACFEVWEVIMDHLTPLILSGGLRRKVASLPNVSVDLLLGKAEQRRAFIVLTFIAHGYLYGVPNADEVIPILPKSLAVPWFELSLLLNINPVVSYSSTALWNWYLIDADGPMDLRY